MSYEIAKEKIKKFDYNNIFHFLKWATQYNILDEEKVKNMDENNFRQDFPFASIKDKDDAELKKSKKTEFALAWFKKKIKSNKQFKINLKDKIESLSGIISDNNGSEGKLSEFISRFIPYSFILHAKVKLTAPYFSSDDDNFYLIQNPCLKEKVFKVPMVRGSGWKGVIAKAGKEIVNEDMTYFESYIRVFGTGSSEYRELIDNLSKDKDIKDKLIKYTLFELGIKLKKENIEQINSNHKGYLKKLLSSKSDINNLSKVPYLQPHKGRAVFYPTYFGSFSLEIINPHSRTTRAGTNPIHYEVVPKGEKGVLQIVYIPFDGILTDTDKLENQVKSDIEFLTKAIEKTADIGIGAKGKLGWGRFEFIKRKVISNVEGVNIPEGWK